MTSSVIEWEDDAPGLREPTMIAAFAGWNDAANAATGALEAIAADFDTKILAHIDPEEFFDFQENRPLIRLGERGERIIDWPTISVIGAPVPGADNDLVLLNAIEPNLKWRTFCDAILDVAETLGVKRVITLGALLADVAHTRPVPVSGLATEPELADKLGLDVSTYEGPTGIIGVLQDRCSARGIEGLSLWAAVPHYVAAVPNPKAALALIRRLEGLSGIAIDGGELEENSERFEEQINEAINFNPEVGEMVARIEAEQATELDFSPDPPSGDEIANEFQRFLRQRNQDN